MSPESADFFLSMMAEHSTTSLLVTNAQRKIIFVNKGFERLTGYTFEEVKGLSPREVLHGQNTDQSVSQEISQSLARTAFVQR